MKPFNKLTALRIFCEFESNTIMHFGANEEILPPAFFKIQTQKLI